MILLINYLHLIKRTPLGSLIDPLFDSLKKRTIKTHAHTHTPDIEWN